MRVLESLHSVARQLTVTALALTASAIAAAGDAGWALPLTAGAGVVVLALLVVAAVLRQRRRTLTVALIAAGREDLPLAVLARERRRLLGRRMRVSLAASLEGLVKEAVNPPIAPGPPIFDRRVVRAVTPELLHLAELLRAEPARARGVALVWCLICEGATSPLHRAQIAELRQELGRIRYLLRADLVDGQISDVSPLAESRSTTPQGGQS